MVRCRNDPQLRYTPQKNNLNLTQLIFKYIMYTKYTLYI